MTEPEIKIGPDQLLTMIGELYVERRGLMIKLAQAEQKAAPVVEKGDGVVEKAPAPSL